MFDLIHFVDGPDVVLATKSSQRIRNKPRKEIVMGRITDSPYQSQSSQSSQLSQDDDEILRLERQLEELKEKRRKKEEKVKERWKAENKENEQPQASTSSAIRPSMLIHFINRC